MEKKMNAFDTTEYAIEKYETELPDMMLEAHEDYVLGNISAENYANALRKIHAIIETMYVMEGKR